MSAHLVVPLGELHMGYRTKHDLQTIPPSARGQVLLAITEAHDGYSPFDGECKWHDHEKDVKAVSLAFPGVIIRIHGEGEEQGDEWVLYAFDGEAVKYRREDWTAPGPPAEWLYRLRTPR